jgi:hypothetical protein
MRLSLTLKVLDKEVELAKAQLGRLPAKIEVWRDGTNIYVSFDRGRGGKSGVFRLDCWNYDTQPPSVSMVHPLSLTELPMEQWTPGVPHSIHPVTNRPFVCIQGVAEYHSHPSHVDDSWDRYRTRFRVPQAILKLLQKAGVLP